MATRFEASAMRRLLNPRSVAIVGASATPGALGAAVLANLERMGFEGEIHLINPKRDRIGERPCLASAEALPMDVDVAVLAIPRAAVLETLRVLARRQVGAAIIFSSGFAEGGVEGVQEQREIARAAAESGMVIEGPNCLGFVNYVDRVALTFVHVPPPPATALADRPGVAIVSQSGAMAAVLGTMLASRELGIAYSVSTGNEAVSGVEDYVDYVLNDPHTRAIGMIVEQFRQPGRFLELARQARGAGKLIVLLHPGRSRAARESASTHTGAMAGDYEVTRTLVERAGVVVAESLEELGDVLEIALRCRTLPSGGAGVVTESGAFKALTLDLCEEVGLALPVLRDDNAPALRVAMPEFVPVSNPVDLTAQPLVDPGLYQRVVAAMGQDERFGCIVLGIIQGGVATSNLKFPHIIEAVKQHKAAMPIVFAGLDEGAAVPEAYVAQLRALGVPCFPTAERALRAVARLSALAGRDLAVNEGAHVALGGSVPRGVVAEYRCKQLLGPVGIAFPAGRLVTSLEEACDAAVAIGFPVVLKAQAVQLSHKSDSGGVVLGLKNAEELAEGWRQLQVNVARHCPGLVLDGVLLERMAPRGIELIIGGRTDPEWGPVVLAGFGGVQAEILRDVRLLPPDLTVAGIVRELNLLKSSALLRGHRGAPAADVEAVAVLIERVSRLLLGEPSIREIDLNPVIVYPKGQGVLALDALMLVDGS